MPRSLSYDISSRYRDVKAYPSTGVFGLSFVNPAVPPLVFPAAPFDFGTGVLDIDGTCGTWRLQIPACSFVGIPGIYEGTYVSLAQPCLDPVAWGQVLRAMQGEGGVGVLLVRPEPEPVPAPAPPGPDGTGCGPTPTSGPVNYALRRGLPKATGTFSGAPFDGAVPVSPFPSWLGTYTPPAGQDLCPCHRDRRPACSCTGRPAYRVMVYPNFCNNPLNAGTGPVYSLVAWNAAASTFVLDPQFDQTPVQPGCWTSWSWELWEQVGGAAATRSSFTGPKRWQCGSGTGIGTVRLRDIYVPCSARLAGGLGYICDLPYIYVQLWPEHGNQCNESFGSFAPIETTQRLTYKVAVNAPGPRVKLWQQLPAGYDSPTASSPQPWTFLHVWVLSPEGVPLQFEPLMPNAYPESGPDRYSQVMLTIDATWLD